MPDFEQAYEFEQEEFQVKPMFDEENYQTLQNALREAKEKQAKQEAKRKDQLTIKEKINKFANYVYNAFYKKFVDDVEIVTKAKHGEYYDEHLEEYSEELAQWVKDYRLYSGIKINETKEKKLVKDFIEDIHDFYEENMTNSRSAGYDWYFAWQASIPSKLETLIWKLIELYRKKKGKLSRMYPTIWEKFIQLLLLFFCYRFFTNY